MSPEQLEEYGPYDEHEDEMAVGDFDESEEWQEGQCDNCPGDSGQAERAAQMASAIVPVCACAIGQGAPPEECQCGPVAA